MFQVSTNLTTILIDSGILFPRDDFYGINYLIPDFSSLKDVKSLIITHGHEDHIGAVHHIVEKFPDVEIFAPQFAKKILEHKFRENKISKKISLYKENQLITCSDLEITPAKVFHSTPDTHALLIIDKKSNTSLFYISDFKLLSAQKLNTEINFSSLAQTWGKYQTRILCADSTNILYDNLTPSENSIHSNLNDIVAKQKGRIFITLFSSNIERIKTIFEVALKNKKTIVTYGRSVKFYMDIASECNLIDLSLIKIKDVESINPDDKNLMIIVSGSQGDFKSALTRISSSNDSIFKPNASDTFIFSSKTIPGNESKVNKILNDLSKLDCNIINSSLDDIHVSGHPSKHDLSVMYNAMNPTHVLPIHGTYSHLKNHVKFIKNKFPKIIPIYLQNHDELSVDNKGKTCIAQTEELRPIPITGNNIPLEYPTISERRKMATTGLISIAVVENSLKGKKTFRFNTEYLGIPQSFDEFHEELNLLIHKTIIKTKNSIDQNQLKIDVRRFFNSRIGIKPTVLITLIC